MQKDPMQLTDGSTNDVYQEPVSEKRFRRKMSQIFIFLDWGGGGLTPKNEARAPELYNIEALEWQF